MRRWWVWALLGLALQLAPWPPAWADAVLLGVTLPIWSQASSRIVSAVPISVGAGLVIFGLAVLVALLVWPGGRARAARAAGWTVAVLLLTFPFTFGLGYHVTPVLEGAPSADEGAYGLARELVLATLATSAPAGMLDTRQVSWEARPLAACVSETVTRLRGRPSPALPTRVKPLPAGSLLRFGFAGVVFPWLLEPHVDSGQPPAAHTAVALHELGHSAGFAREAETEAVATLAGLNCEDREVRYAAALRAAASLASRLPPPERAEYVSRWPEVAVADLRAANEATARYRSAPLSRIVQRAYDAYLVSQGTEEGMADYDRATDLLVRLLAAGYGAPAGTGAP